MRKHTGGTGDDRYRAIFDHVAVSLWEEDISRLREKLRTMGCAPGFDLRAHLRDHPEFVQEALGLVEVTNVNEASIQLFEAQGKNQLLGPLPRILRSVSRGNMTAMILAICDGTENVEVEATGRTFTGRELSLLVKAYIPPRDSPDGRMLVSLIDVTGRREAEEKERISSDLLRGIIESVPDAVCVKDRDLRMVLCNRVHSRAVEKEPEETYGKTDVENGWDEDLVKGNPSRGIAGWEKDDLAALAGRTVQVPGVPSNVGGAIRYFDAVKFPLRDRTGAVVGVAGIGRDVTERSQLEQRNQQLATLVESSDDAIVGIGMDRRITVWNKGAERIYGYTAEEMIGSSTTRLIPEELEEEARQIRERLVRGERIEHFETVRLRKDGTRIIVSLGMSGIRDASGTVVGMATVAQDITAQKAIQARLARVQRLESVATLAGGVAHQFNNIHTVIKGYLGMLQGEPQLSERLRSFVAAADEALNRAVDITDRLLMMTEPPGAPSASVALDALIRDVLSGFETLLSREATQLVLELAHAPTAAGEESRLRFVVACLVTNALDAMLDRPRRVLTVRTGTTAEGAFFEVEDTGCGIPASNLPKLFTPFFSTKGEWAASGSPQARLKGLGLSLSIASSAVGEFGGRIDATSVDGAGSVFRVVLPLAPAGTRGP